MKRRNIQEKIKKWKQKRKKLKGWDKRTEAVDYKGH